MKQLFCSIFLCVFSIGAFAQDFSKKVEFGEIEFGTEKISAFQTQFPFSQQEVERSLWKFCQSFAKTINLRTHYEVRISVSGSNVILLAQVEKTGASSTRLKLALKDKALKSKYDPQVKRLLLRFKQQFFLDYYQAEIELLEARATSVAKLNIGYLKNDGQGSKEHLKTIQLIARDIQELRDKQQALAY